MHFHYICYHTRMHPKPARNPRVRVQKCTRGFACVGFFPTSRVCLWADFRKTRTPIRGCHPWPQDHPWSRVALELHEMNILCLTS